MSRVAKARQDLRRANLLSRGLQGHGWDIQAGRAAGVHRCNGRGCTREKNVLEGLNNGRSSPAQEQDGREESLHWRALLRPREQVGRSRRTCPDAFEVDVGFGVRNDMGLVGGVVAGAEMAAGDGWGWRWEGEGGEGEEGIISLNIIVIL